MELELYWRIIDEIAGQKKLSVLWLHKDGEPLLCPQIDWLVALAKKKKVAGRVEIYTNGRLLDRVMAKRLIEAKLDSLVVSLDATDRESFRKLKGRDAYQQVVANIHRFLRTRKKLRAKNPLLSVKTIDFGNQEEVAKFKKTWSGVADEVVVQPLHEWEGSIKSLRVQKFKGLRGRYPCNLPWLSPAVNWDGKVMPCCVNYRENELVMGDLTRLSLAEIWQGEKFKKLRQAHLDQDFAEWPTCARCSFWQRLPNMRAILKIKNRNCSRFLTR